MTTQDKYEAMRRTLDRYFGGESPDSKDMMRADNFMKRVSADPHTQYNYCVNMARKIKKPDKAYRRGVAFQNVGADPDCVRVFHKRAFELIGGTL